MSASSRLPAALLALSALAACATTGQTAATDPSGLTATPPRSVDRQARQRIAREDMLSQMAFWAGEYQTFPNDLEAAQRFSEALRKGGRVERAVQISGQSASFIAAIGDGGGEPIRQLARSFGAGRCT